VGEPDIVGGVNLLVNPSFEDELNHWLAHNPAKCSVASVGAPVRTGSAAVKVFDRASSQTGIQQDVTEQLRDNGPGEYTYSAFVRARSGTVPVCVALKTVDDDGTHYHPAPSVEANPDAWLRTQRTHNVTWSNLIEACIYVESGWGHTGTYFIDDCAFVRGHRAGQ
jgi:hypothetical protein